VTPTVLLHGFLGAPTAWDEVVRFLEPTGEVLAPALPCHGLRPWVPSCTTFDETVDAFAERLPARAHLVGYSMGARVALGITARHPARAASLTVVGLHPGLEDDAERRARRAWDEGLARDVETKDLGAFVDAWEKLPLWDTQRALPDAVRARRREERLAQVPTALAWALRTLGLGAMPPMWDALAAQAVPVHLITGARDEKFTTIAQLALERAPRCRHTAIGGVGHDVGLEAPRAFASILRTVISGARER
jgi:2-succinyl-6-hydroxy-2,4-cyclohexadiene-1-carboxylate synthase